MNGSSSQPTAPPPPPDFYMEAPPPYSTIAPDRSNNSPPLRSPANRIFSSPSQNSTNKLCHMDFLPRLVKKKFFGKDEYETFSDLIKRFNQWLGDHDDAIIITIETVTWFDNDCKDIFTDDSSFVKTHTTQYLTGIRLWFLMPLIPMVSLGERKKTIHCITYPHKPSSSTTHLFTTINQALASGDPRVLGAESGGRVVEAGEGGGAEGGGGGGSGGAAKTLPKGRVVSVETLEATCVDGFLDTERTHFKYDTGETRYIFMALRVYLLEEETTQGYESIEYQDFIPGRTGRNKENKGFELFTEVAERGARWMARKGGVRFVNLQVVNVKLKRDTPVPERGRYKDQCSTLLQILRAYYTIPHHPHPRDSPPPPLTSETRLSVRTFKPRVLNGDRYEDMRVMMAKINQWLALTGAQIKSIETLCVHAANKLGYDATVLHSRSSKNQLGRYVFHVRLYLDGAYSETPSSSALLV